MYTEFISKLDKNKYKLNEPLGNHVPLRIGGPADILYIPENVTDLKDVIALAREYKVPVTVIGGGSNTLISDEGLRGLVVMNTKGDIKIGDVLEKSSNEKEDEDLVYRWESDDKAGTFRGIQFKDLDYRENDCERVQVVMESGVGLEYALYYLIERGITGLQWYAGIPGTIGGAIFNNIHGGTHFISEILSKVEVIDLDGNIKTLSIEELTVDYDRSRFHKSKEIILRGYFSMFKGDKEKAMFVAKEWAKRKKVQPRNSPGCCFTNITQEQKTKLGYPTTSTGYIVEHVLKMTGLRIGDAMIYPDHHNFIVNVGNATASDYLSVVRTIYERIYNEVGIKVVPEIFFLGFKDEEISFLLSDEQLKQRKIRHDEIKSVYRK